MGVSTSRVTLGFQEIADGAHQPAAALEDRADFFIHHQVEVALAVADFDVGEAVPFFRQRQQRLGEELQVLRVHGELAGLGAEQIALDADQVAQVEELVKLEVAFADGVQSHVDLQALATSGQVGKTCLAVRANGHDTARNAHRDLARGEFFGRERGVFPQNLGDRVRNVVLARVGLKAQVDNRLELFLALLDQVLKFLLGHADNPQPAEDFRARVKAAL